MKKVSKQDVLHEHISLSLETLFYVKKLKDSRKYPWMSNSIVVKIDCWAFGTPGIELTSPAITAREANCIVIDDFWSQSRGPAYIYIYIDTDRKIGHNIYRTIVFFYNTKSLSVKDVS